jgi:NAD(P)-dependent dehydrogenase (short-subunit alcohol dehydrogenase family)
MMTKDTIFITGAATGIGLATARKLDGLGWQVFAGVLPGQDTSDLQAGGTKISPIEVDITDDKMVRDAAEFVADQVGINGLRALINNAGVAHLGSGVLAGASIEETRQLFEINVFGAIRVTQAFLPLLHQYGRARIVNMSSGAVRVQVPTSGTYTMSKYAIEGFTKTLRYELAPFGIEVTAIEPGGVRTPMTDGAEANIQRVWESMSPEVRQRYEATLRPANENLVKTLETANSPEYIADGIIHALTTDNPRPRYTVGKETRPVPILQRLLSEKMYERLMMGQFGLKRK